MTRPLGRLAAVTLLLTGALAQGAPVAAHTPVADIGCFDGKPLLTVDLARYDPAGTNRVRVRVDGQLRFDRTFPATFHSSSFLGSGFRGHTVAVRVIAWDDPDGSLGYSKVFRLVSPPCRHHRPVPGRAALYGPFLDPMYYARFWAGSDTCTFRWTRVDGGQTKVIERTVAAGRSQSTKLKHADGGTIQTIRGCGVSITRTTAPGGDYGAP